MRKTRAASLPIMKPEAARTFKHMILLLSKEKRLKHQVDAPIVICTIVKAAVQ